MEIEQKETDCKCDNSTGWTTIKCCNQCGKSIEPFWRVDNKTQTEKDETGRDIIGIEEKEMERIENYYNGSLMDEEHRDYAKLGARTEHLHFQKEVIQPMKSVMIAAAEEIMRVWPAHCDDEGYGPTNLMHRLEKGILALSNPRDRRNAQVELEKRFIILRTPPTNQTEKR